MLNEILNHLTGLPPDKLAQVVKETLRDTRQLKFVPNSGRQTQAYRSEADLLLFGGEPSGGKTSLIIGLALNEHENSLIMRRQYTDLDSIIKEAIQFNGTRDGFNGSSPPTLRHDRGIVKFGACASPGDEDSWIGRARDLLGLDEACQFTRRQVRMLMGWLRTTNPKQRVRCVMATNPPLNADGLWVFEMFGPWLDPQHPNPAKPGELRWFVTDDEDRDMEVDGPGEHEVGGKMRFAQSRTYIPSGVSDNPFINEQEYRKQLDSLPAEERKILMGGFRSSFKDKDFQLIPTAWVVAAQERWQALPPKNVPLCAIGADVASGGDDYTVLAKRHDQWYAPLVKVPGKQTPLGSDVAGLIFSHLRDNAVVNIDMGGGYGGGPYELLKDNGVDVRAYKGAESSHARTQDGKMKFTNIRTEALWRMREALDPDQPGGSQVQLPPSATLLADLTAATFKVTPNGYAATPKDVLTKLLQRSTDEGDAVCMCNFVGLKAMNVQGGFPSRVGRKHKKELKVSLGRFDKRH